MTLGEMKDQGLMPSATQIHMLEIEVSKECRAFNYPHRYHCLPLSTEVQKTMCWEIVTLWRNLEEMFPGIQIDKG